MDGQLLPLQLTREEVAELVVPPDDPWMITAAEAVVAHLGVRPEDAPATVVPVWFKDAELGGEPWRIRGVGRLVLTPSGRPLVGLHAPGRPVCFTAPQALTVPAEIPTGRVCYAATWFRSTERPYLVELWEMLFQHPAKDVNVRVYWRPDFAPPKRPKMASDVSGLSRTRRRAVEDALWDFLEGPPVGGRTKKGRSLSFERVLERVVRELIIADEGEPIAVQRLLVHLAMDRNPSRYYRELERAGLTPQQVLDWIDDARRDYRATDRDAADWQLPEPLATLPRSFRN